MSLDVSKLSAFQQRSLQLALDGLERPPAAELHPDIERF